MRYNNIKILKDENNKKYYSTYERIYFPKDKDDIYIIWRDYYTTQNLAYKYYDDPELWWVILSANSKKLESDFFTGEVIRLPNEPMSIINNL